MLQEMLTGSPPFVADTIPDIHALVLTTAPTPLRSGFPDATQPLEDIVLKCLQKAPADRFATVLELAQALAAVVPAVQGSVDRIARITVGGSGPRARLSSPGGFASSVPPPRASAPELVETAAAEDALPRSSREPPPAQSLETVSATGRRTLGDTLRRSPLTVSIAVAGVLAAIGISIVALRHHAPPAQPATVAPIVPATPSAAPPAPIAPIATGAPTLEATETAESAPSATASSSEVLRAHGARPHHHASAAASASVAAKSAAPPPPPPPQDSNAIDYGGRN